MKWLWLLSLPFSFWSNQTRMRGMPDRCTSISIFSQEWLDFKEPLEMFNGLGTEYSLRGDSVLAWYRDCALLKTLEIDIARHSYDAHIIQINLVLLGWSLTKRSSHRHVVLGELWTKGDRHIVIRIADTMFAHTRVRWNGLHFHVPDPVEGYLRDLYGNWSMVYLRS